MRESFVLATDTGPTLETVLASMSEATRTRLHDLGEVCCVGGDSDAVREALSRAGVAEDTLVRVLQPVRAERGVLALQTVVTGVLGENSELSTVVFAPAARDDLQDDDLDLWSALVFASKDYFRYSRATPQWRVEAVVAAGYAPKDLDQDARGAIERCLIRASRPLDEIAEALLLTTDDVHPVISVLESAVPTVRVFPGDVSVLAHTLRGSGAGPGYCVLILVQDEQMRALCALVLTRL